MTKALPVFTVIAAPRFRRGNVTRRRDDLRMRLDTAPALAGLALVVGAWIGHRLLRFLERRGWVYYLGRDA